MNMGEWLREGCNITKCNVKKADAAGGWGELQHVLTGRGNKLESFLHFRPSMRPRSAGEIIVIIIDV